MKSTLKNADNKDHISLNYPNHPGDGDRILVLQEWENGEGYDFIFPEGNISLSYFEFKAMEEIVLLSGRLQMLKK